MTLRPTLVALALLLVACGSKEAAVEVGGDPASIETSTTSKTGEAINPSSGSENPAGTKPGEAPPNFELPVLSGGSGTLSLADMKGKVILLTFWASWCGPCRMEVPALEKPWKELRDMDAVVLGISIDDNEPAAKSFLSMFPVTYPMLLDVGGRTVADTWGVSSIPATIVIDKQGVVRKRHLGYSPTMLANTVKLVRELEQE